ncbi:membrane protein FxsA [Halobacteriales archaeon SW_7_65_23]|nr:MAG: membrane protein FxsA [Halobacteriales archaeon SW_7_65_23]
MLRLIGLLLLIPLIDALLLVVATAYLGWQLVVLLVVLTALVGLLLVRVEGRHTLAKIQRKVARGEAPTDELIDGGLLIAAGAFLLTPGLVTDAVGFLIVLPLTRYPIRVALKKWVITPYADEKTGGFATGNVYIGGFPGDGVPDEGGAPGQQSGSDGPDDGFDDATDVEFNDVDER